MKLRKQRKRTKAFNLAYELESLAFNKGWAVSLVYDDQGNWAFCDDGFQNIRSLKGAPGLHDDDLSISWLVKGGDFKSSIGEAWKHFVQKTIDSERHYEELARSKA